MIEFVHPAFLWALPAVSLPVLIQLLNRLRYRRVAWAVKDQIARVHPMLGGLIPCDRDEVGREAEVTSS